MLFNRDVSSRKMALHDVAFFLSSYLIFISLLSEVNGQTSITESEVLTVASTTVGTIDLVKYCNGNCTNGKCDSNGACVCSDGFKKSANGMYKCVEINCPTTVDITEDKKYCKELCKTRCVNGSCHSGGRCDCNPGFTLTGSDKKFGCVAIMCPSTEKDSNFCITQCNKDCLNGTCDTTGKCKCLEGFKNVPKNQYVCQEILCPSNDLTNDDYCKVKSCKMTCNSGKCDKKGKCKCNEGYEKSSIVNNTCSPICTQECRMNQFCSAPDKCLCTAGYIAIASRGECVLKCNSTMQCVHGICEKGTCRCQLGYELGWDNQCHPICSRGCTNGECILPGKCLCNEGFVRNNGECLEKQNVAAIVSGLVGAVVLAYLVGKLAWFLNRKFNCLKLKSKDDVLTTLGMVQLTSDDGRPPCPLPRPANSGDMHPPKKKTQHSTDPNEPAAEYLDLFPESELSAKESAKHPLQRLSAAGGQDIYQNVEISRATQPPHVTREDSVQYENVASGRHVQQGGSSTSVNPCQENDLDDDGYLLPSTLNACRKNNSRPK